MRCPLLLFFPLQLICWGTRDIWHVECPIWAPVAAHSPCTSARPSVLSTSAHGGWIRFKFKPFVSRVVLGSFNRRHVTSGFSLSCAVGSHWRLEPRPMDSWRAAKCDLPPPRAFWPSLFPWGKRRRPQTQSFANDTWCFPPTSDLSLEPQALGLCGLFSNARFSEKDGPGSRQALPSTFFSCSNCENSPPLFSEKPAKQFDPARPTHAWCAGQTLAAGGTLLAGAALRDLCHHIWEAWPHTRCLGHPPGWGIVLGEANHGNLPSATGNRSIKQEDALLSTS